MPYKLITKEFMKEVLIGKKKLKKIHVKILIVVIMELVKMDNVSAIKHMKVLYVDKRKKSVKKQYVIMVN